MLSLVAVNSNDLREVDEIFDELSVYSLRVDGVLRRNNAAYEFATALPPGYQPRHKYAFVAKCEGVAVGLLDIIDGYPSPRTTFIGLLAIRESAQESGVGRALFRKAERFASNDLKARTLRLAVVEANPIIGFWMKMGFHLTGEVKPYEGELIKSRSILMEKALRG